MEKVMNKRLVLSLLAILPIVGAASIDAAAIVIQNNTPYDVSYSQAYNYPATLKTIKAGSSLLTTSIARPGAYYIYPTNSLTDQSGHTTYVAFTQSDSSVIYVYNTCYTTTNGTGNVCSNNDPQMISGPLYIHGNPTSGFSVSNTP